MPGVLLLGWDHTNNQVVKVAVDENGIIQMSTTVGNLDDIGDVDVASPTDLYIFYWNNTNSKFEVRAFADWASVYKLDDLAAPDDNTDLDGSSAKHGLYPKADAAKLAGIAAGADVTGDNAPQDHAASHQNGGADEVSVTGLSGLLADDQHVLDSEVIAAVGVCDICFIIDGGGSAITTGIKGDLEIPFACTINQVTMLADQSGSIVVDIWKDTYANFPPTDADSITASAPPTISAATKDQDSTLTGWTTAISAGDILRFNVDSCSTITRVTISLKVTRT